MLSVTQALENILAAVPRTAGHEVVDLRTAPGRILADAVVCGFDVPPYDNSAMDGYALRAADLPDSGEAALSVIGTVFAGQPFDGTVGPGQCVRIMTGAMLPQGADTVVMQEHARREGDSVYVGSGEQPGQHVRPRGEELRAGDTVLHPGIRLGPAQIGLIASLGQAEVAVKRRPRVAFFSTGDELRPLGAELAPGQIYDSNRYTLFSMLARLPVEPVDLGRIPDDKEAVARTFEQAARQADVVITSGGVSVGDADYVTETLQRMGQINFWKIAMKPGHPLAFGFLEQAVFFGLPGNPVSAMVTFYQFVQPALLRMLEQESGSPLRLHVRSASRLRKKPGRLEFQRGILERGADGELQVRSSGLQSSAMLTSVSNANCLIILPAESAGAAEGDRVEVEPFHGVLG